MQSASWHGQRRWWLSDASTAITGKERAVKLVSQIIDSETVTHAHDKTDRRQPRKGQKRNDHSVFRQLAESFRPPKASGVAIQRNQSNHPTAGESRKIGVTVTRDYLHSAGFKMYDESISLAGRDHKANGRREIYDIKDLQHYGTDDKYEPGMVYTLVDQDFYIDSFEQYAGENIVIITPEYGKLAGVGTDSVWWYTVSQRGEVVVTERVATENGATYRDQRPWDYSANDFIYLEHRGKKAFTTYNVHVQYQPGSHHKWVWLARNTTTHLSKKVCDAMQDVVRDSNLCGVTLKKASNVTLVRLDPEGDVQDWFLHGVFGDPKSPTHSIKYLVDEGPDTSMELTENQYKVFTLMGRNRPKGYGVSEVKRTMQIHSMWRPGGLEPLLVAFFGIPIEYRPRPNIMYTSQAGSLDDGIVEEGNAVEAAPNIAGGGPGVADTKSKAAHQAYKKERLEKYKNKIDPPQQIKDIIDLLLPKFILLISKESGYEYNTVPLVARDVIYQTRTGALQAARLKRDSELVARDTVPKSSLKHEVAPKSSPAPRAVTQYTEEMAIQTGRVGLLIKEVLKNCEFYQPGNSPSIIAKNIKRCAEMAAYASDEEGVSGLHDTDYSKMDETISKYIYYIFVEVVLAFVHPNDYEEVKKVLDDNVDFVTLLDDELVAVGFKNNSGSGVTTELNTVVSAFIEYVTNVLAITRVMYRSKNQRDVEFSDIKKSTIKIALKRYAEDINKYVQVLWGTFMFEGLVPDPFSIPYAVIGPKYGDDGIGPHLPTITDDVWEKSAIFLTQSIGMVLKVSFSTPEQGTYFLGRCYPRPLESLASYADVCKAVRKLSVAKSLSVEKYKLKLLGYWTTDSKTPVIRQFLMVVAKLYDLELKSFEGMVELDEEDRPVLSTEMQRLYDLDRDTFYRVIGGPYDVQDEDIPMMLEAIAEQVNFNNVTELNNWLDGLMECSTWAELDEYLLPGMGYDPDDDHEAVVRMSGPVANLLTLKPMDHEALKAIEMLTTEDLTEVAECLSEDNPEAASGEPSHAQA